MLTYFHHTMRFLRESTMPEREVRNLITRHGCAIVNMSYTCTNEGKYFDYDMIISTRSQTSMDRLCQTLTEQASIIEFRISPTGD
jgi:putative Mg2+ transporter-C (MgtC) family protein